MKTPWIDPKFSNQRGGSGVSRRMPRVITHVEVAKPSAMSKLKKLIQTCSGKYNDIVNKPKIRIGV